MPSEIVIMGVPYSVEYVDVVDKASLCRGQIDFMEGTIRIDRTQPIEAQQQTLIHEALHGICEALGLAELNDSEGAISGLASAIYCTFKEVFTASWSARERFRL